MRSRAGREPPPRGRGLPVAASVAARGPRGAGRFRAGEGRVSVRIRREVCSVPSSWRVESGGGRGDGGGPGRAWQREYARAWGARRRPRRGRAYPEPGAPPSPELLHSRTPPRLARRRGAESKSDTWSARRVGAKTGGPRSPVESSSESPRRPTSFTNLQDAQGRGFPPCVTSHSLCTSYTPRHVPLLPGSPSIFKVLKVFLFSPLAPVSISRLMVWYMPRGTRSFPYVGRAASLLRTDISV